MYRNISLTSLQSLLPSREFQIRLRAPSRFQTRRDSREVEIATEETKVDAYISSYTDQEIKQPEDKPINTSISMNQTNRGELIAISAVYFVEGFVALSALTETYFLKDILGQNPEQVSLLESWGRLPWVVKPLYGFASDSLPIFGYRRRSYLVLCGILGSLAFYRLGSAATTPLGAEAMLLASSVSTACSDVVVDSIVVERARGESQEDSGSLQSLCWASMAVGGIVSSYSGGYLVEKLGPREVIRWISLLPLLITFTAFLVKENRIKQNDQPPRTSSAEISTSPSPDFRMSNLKSQVKSLWTAFRNKDIYLPAIFLFVYNATPSGTSAMFFFETNELHFSPEFFGRVTLIGQIAHLVGVGVYRFFLQSVPLRKIFKWTCILTTILGLSQLILISRLNVAIGLSDELFLLGDSAVLGVFGQVAFMPLLVLAARLCPDGVEATLFALLMSIVNGGMIFGGVLGGELTKWVGVTEEDFSNLGLLMSICILSNLLPLLLLNLIPSDEVKLEAD